MCLNKKKPTYDYRDSVKIARSIKMRSLSTIGISACRVLAARQQATAINARGTVRDLAASANLVCWLTQQGLL